MPGLPRKVEKLWKKSAKPAGSPPSSAITTSATGRSPKRCSRRASSVATTSCERRSYSASSFMKERIRGTSSSEAARMRTSPTPAAEGLGAGVGDADEGLGDLDGVRRRTLEQVVGDAPVLDRVPFHPNPPDVRTRLASDLQRRRIVRRVARE